MWEQRNVILHSDGSTIHQYESSLLDQEIAIEWERQYTLPYHYAHLFTGTLQARLQKSMHQKRRWLTSIWTAQERGIQLRDDGNIHIVNLYDRWKKKFA